MGNCRTCGFIGDTHLHHILPRSKGGSDDVGNLIEVCHPCHREIHNASFGGEVGLIRTGLEKLKDNSVFCEEWFGEKCDDISKFILDFSEFHETDIISDMMRYGVIYHIDFYEMLKTGRHKKIKGDIPKMLKEFYDKLNYSFL